MQTQQLRSKTKSFTFQRDPELIQCTPLDFESRLEFAESMTDEQIRKYIVDESAKYKAERERDVSPGQGWRRVLRRQGALILSASLRAKRSDCYQNQLSTFDEFS